MKKWMLLMLTLMLAVVPAAFGEEAQDWSDAPVITKAYEQSTGKLYLEWEGNAPVYQVHMDGKSVADSTACNKIIPVEKGTHTIVIYPVNEVEKEADTKIDFNVSVVSFNVDLAALGLDATTLSLGKPSQALNIDYTPNPIFNAAPEKPVATTDFNDCVRLSFVDRYNADEYLVTIKAGSDVNYVRFNKEHADAAALISKTNTMVMLTLNQQFLQSQGCLIPELGSKYTFSVQLRKYAADLQDGDSVKTVIHESKESGGCSYTPVAAWKTAPVITDAAQTGDGQVVLQWTHEDNGLGCEYAVMKINKKLGLQTGEEQIGLTTEKTFEVQDLPNGEHLFAVAPVYRNEKGDTGEAAGIKVQNGWEAVPDLKCEQVDGNHVKLMWTGLQGADSYRISIYAGDSGSLLRFVDMDFKKQEEINVASVVGPMEYLYSWKGDISTENGTKLKFEICGVHLTSDGKEQLTESTSQTLTLK